MQYIKSHVKTTNKQLNFYTQSNIDKVINTSDRHSLYNVVITM